MGEGVPQMYTLDQQLPENAVVMTQDMVIKYQLNRIDKWKPPGEVWPLRYYVKFLSASTTIACCVIDQTMRSIFYLGNHKRLVTLMPTLIVPTLSTVLLYKLLVTHRIITGNAPCTPCMAIKGGSLQSLQSTIYPLVISTLGCYMLARDYHTYGGKFNKNQIDLIKWIKVPRGAKSLLGAAFGFNFLLGAFLAYKQTECFENVLMKPALTNSKDMDFE